MNNDRRSRLLGLDLKFFRQFNTNPRRIEQLKQFRLILKVRTSRIAKTETRALIALPEQFLKIRGVVIRNTQFPANVPVPVLSQSFSTLHAQAVKIEIVGITI